MTDRLLVMGATGDVGGALFRQLHAAGAEVRAVVRDPGRAQWPAGADVVVGDFDEPHTIAAAAVGVRAAFVLGGRRDLPGLLSVLRTAGIERVVLLTSRSVIGRVAGNAIADMWATSEADLVASGLAWTILRPSGFMSNARRWLPQLRAGDVVRAAFTDVAIAAIDAEDLAGVAAAALVRPELAGECLELSGPEALLPATQLALLGHALRRPLRLEPLTGDAARAELARRFPPAFVEAQLRFFVDGEFDDTRVVQTVARLLGRPPRSFAQWVAAHAAELRASTH
jgi:uncharacterized protein YbjT (DUF2867 family)